MISRVVAGIVTGIYAMRVSNRLFDLGINANRVGPVCGEILQEIEQHRRREFSPHEAAAYFFGATFSNLPKACYLAPLSAQELAFRADTIMSTWVREGKMRAQWASSIKKTLNSQL